MLILKAVLFVFVLRPSFSFDAGFVQWASSRDGAQDTTHYAITACALCRVTADYLKTVYKIDISFLERKFNQTDGKCQGSVVDDLINLINSPQARGANAAEFETMLKTVASANTKTDLKEMFKEESHFDSERIAGGSELILKRFQVAIDSMLNLDYADQARKSIGELMHTLQDFYSHTNYIELGFSSPIDVLGQRVFREDEYASKSTRTCISCTGSECQTKPNLDEAILRRKLLTSGYFIPLGFGIFQKKKPAGKCSHGGSLDGSSTDEPIGGINKDTLGSVHGHLHYRAANMAFQASVKILQQFQARIGNDAFALFLTLNKKLNSLVISIDTDCAAADYIVLAIETATNIVNQYQRLEYAPHNYILVTFNNAKAQLVLRTVDPRNFTAAIRSLNACQSDNITDGNSYYQSLVAALKVCEYASVIYTFTDSPARDANLKDQARALLRTKKAVVYSFLGKKIMRRQLKTNSREIDPLDGTGNDTDLASISGGLTFPITDLDRPIISEFILNRLDWMRIQSLAIAKAQIGTMTFAVDASIDELHLDISSLNVITEINRFQLRGPRNEIYTLSNSSRSTNFLYMWKMSKPNVGTWQLTVVPGQNTIDYNVQIQGKTNVTCSSILQRKMEANADSSGYTQFTNEPLINSTLYILTNCAQLTFSNVTIALVDVVGRTIAAYKPTESDRNGIFTEILIPQEKFRIQTRMTLADGSIIQRLEKQLITPTMYSIELFDQPYVLGIGETIQLNYTIRSRLRGTTKLRLQIVDTLQILTNDTIELNISFVNQTSGSYSMTLPNRTRERSIIDSVTFALASQNDQTKRFIYENDETFSVYLELNSAGRSKDVVIHCMSIFFLFLFLMTTE